MIFLINSTYRIWLPFYIFNAREYRNPIFAFLMVFEFFISVFCVIITIKLTIYILRVRVFHVNMNILAVAYLWQYVECFIAKTMITLYQNGYVPVAGIDPERKFKQWWSVDGEDIPAVGSVLDAWPLFIGSFLIWHYLYSVIFFIFSFCAERAMATILSGNYEKHSRTYISLLILATSHTLTIHQSYLTFYEHVDFLPSVIFCMIAVTVSVVIFFVILLINLKINKVQASDRSNDFYTLAFRFQVKENIKALKLAFKVIICIGFYIFVNMIILFVVFFELMPSWSEVLTFFLENFIYLNPLIICPVVIFSIEPWHRALLQDLPKFKSKHSNRLSVSEKRVESRSATDMYFNQLQTSWTKK